MFIVFKISDFVLFRILKAISRLFLDSTSVSAKHSDSRMHFYQQYHYLQSAGKNSVIAKGKYNTHLMYGPEGNRSFCFPSSLDVSQDELSGNISKDK